MKISLSKKQNVKLLLFIEQFEELLRHHSFEKNLNCVPKIKFINLNHHLEIIDISITDENENKKTMFKFFKKYYIILLAENNLLKIILSLKDKNINGYIDLQNNFSDFKKFITENIEFKNKDFDELILLD